jgi:hypothetical protein
MNSKGIEINKIITIAILLFTSRNHISHSFRNAPIYTKSVTLPEPLIYHKDRMELFVRMFTAVYIE